MTKVKIKYFMRCYVDVFKDRGRDGKRMEEKAVKKATDTGNSTQYSAMPYMGKESKKEGLQVYV